MFSIENQGTNTYLSYQINNEDKIDDLSLGMLTNNKIKGFAQVLYTQLDDKYYVKYNISSKVSAKKALNGTITKDKLLRMVSDILSAVMAAEEYMIDPSLLVLDLNNVYVDILTYEPVLICLPVLNRTSKMDLHSFFKVVFFCAQYDQSEDCNYVPTIINYLNSVSVFSVNDFKKLVDSLMVTKSERGRENPKSQIQHETPRLNANKDTSKPYRIPANEPKRAELPNQPYRQSQSATGINEKGKKGTDGNIDVNKLKAIPQKGEKNNDAKMSLLYLLKNYNKENLEKYRSQKASGKSAINKSAYPSKPNKTPPSQKATKQQFSNSSIAIPGQTPKQPELPNTALSSHPQMPNQSINTNIATSVNDTNLFSNARPVTKNEDFGNTTVLFAPGVSNGETSLLSSYAASPIRPKPYLVRTKNGEKVLIDKPRFRIGKEKSYVDYFIADNTAISRSHADIITKDGSYYIVDLNSTNRTFVNERELKNNEEIQIKSGNRIKLANEEFEFIEEL